MAVHPSITGLPDRPRLRPGLAVARHDAHYLQVGIDPPHRLLLPDLPEVRRVLAALTQGVALPPVTTSGWTALRGLTEADLLVDAAEVERLGSSPSILAAWAQFGREAPARLAEREVARVGVVATGDVQEALGRLLHEAGAALAGPGEHADAWLVATDGEVPRSALDALVREEAPHLVLGGMLGSLRLGPFVLPGVTACLRCVDAHLAESDPRRGLVLEQVATPSSFIERPRDPVLHALALAWAARDLLRFVEGERPSTWSTSFDLGPSAAPVAREWRRHPHCGCAWDSPMLDGWAV